MPQQPFIVPYHPQFDLPNSRNRSILNISEHCVNQGAFIVTSGAISDFQIG